MKTLHLILGLPFLFFLVAGICDAEELHNWAEPNPNYTFQNGDVVEELFYVYTSKQAERSESGGSWTVTGSATASANARASAPRGGDLIREWNASARLQATGDNDLLEPHSGDGMTVTEDGNEKTLTSSDGTTTARTKRVAHVISYQNQTVGPPKQRFLDDSTSGGKSETSVSPTDLDANPWARSKLEVSRRTNTVAPVADSPFISETPKCSSSGNGHTCKGATPPPKKKEVVYCRRGDACGKKPGVKGKRDAHQIDCPERTYNQNGILLFLNIKIEEDCKGEKWSCHSDPDNCSRSHLHLRKASEAKSGEKVFNGYVVPAGYSVGACGLHLYASGSSASDHALQASCSEDSKCIATNFYKCQHDKHEYATPKSASLSGSSTAKAGSLYRIDLTTPSPYRYMYWYVRDPGQSGRGRLVRSVSGSRRSYTASLSYRFPSSVYTADYVITAFVRSVDGSESEISHTVRVENDLRQTRVVNVKKEKEEKKPVVKQEVTPVSQPTDTSETKEESPPPTDPKTKEEDPPPPPPKKPDPDPPRPKRQSAVCSAGHTYYTDSTYARNRHKDRTCTRCSLTYQNCTNHGTACQNSKWHTEDPSAAPKPKTTTTTNNNNGGNSNSNNNGNSNNGNSNNNNNGGNQNTAPPAPSKPTPTYHACGIHRSSVSGDHSLQASCSTDSNCIATNFYQCMHLVHKYATPPPRTSTDPPRRPKPDPPPPKPKSACPADSWSKCGGSSSHAATCSAGHSYYTCASQAWHKDRTCSRCSQTYQDCTNSSSACQGSKWHTDKAIQTPKPKPTPTTVKCARQACGETVSDRLAHKVSVCSSGCGNHYWTCIDGATDRHTKTYTCRREGCGKTFTKCTNTPTACVRAGKPSNYHWAK